jgi:ABC-type multidrug transport system fused ATPase/permease subunit
VLVLVEPTSAVDAHTEARVAAGSVRSGWPTTVVVTVSPLVLDHADRVVLLDEDDTGWLASGTHRELLHADPRHTEASSCEGRPTDE